MLESGGLPMGIQLLGRPHGDYALGCIGRWMMDAFPGRGSFFSPEMALARDLDISA